MVVLHYTAMDRAEAALERLCDPLAEVSAHYLIAEDGRSWQLVDEAARAWHAGAGAWGNVGDVNSRSIGIELANPGDRAFAPPQMERLEALLAGILARWNIAPERVIGHSDMAVGRKADPGRWFDWARLARAGLSIAPAEGEPGDFHRDLRHFGYRWGAGDEPLLLDAFRSRFRPAASGPLCDADRRIAAGLARDWPCRAE
ncbi:N-acetylmuramoyl-L-alanine amidase [Aquicoccus sp. SCR17]|nr:N-acetylmuramoyl-L-alanine amidase [Carideicomes alvinocaridis]